MDQKEFEDKLDKYATKLSSTVSDGISRMEEMFDKAKENLKSDEPTAEKIKAIGGSPRTGQILIGFGIVWLLYCVGVFDNIVFPILLIILGVYFVIRNR